MGLSETIKYQIKKFELNFQIIPKKSMKVLQNIFPKNL